MDSLRLLGLALQPESRADWARSLLNDQDNRPCDGTTHTLTCFHSITLNTRACSTSCRRPQFGNKARHPHVCPICTFKSEEEKLLEEVAAIHDMRNQLEAVRSDYTNPHSSREVDYLDDLIFQSKMNLQRSVSRSLWSLYARAGEEGVRNQQAARELEEAETFERRYIQLMRREWYVTKADAEERQRQRVLGLAAKGYVSEIQAIISLNEQIIAQGIHGGNLISREQCRLDVESAHERLQTLRPALAVAEAHDPVDTERHRAAERRERVEELESELESGGPALEHLRDAVENPSGDAIADEWAEIEYSDALAERVHHQEEIEQLRALGLGDPTEHDTEPGEV